jgi:RNA polymerase sigma factor (sigma-70 family)
METGPKTGTMRQLRGLFLDGTAVGLGDGQLLARYGRSRDESAFEALVARHGPMVIATCRAVLRHEHDVEDAFQATFLILARKARTVRACDALGGWLHRVAYRAAVQARVESRRRRLREAEATVISTLFATHSEPDPEIASIVHEEVDRLPDRLRLPVVLCDLEGLTYEEAARRLCWTEPTLRHRLVRARQRLREQLIRRGVTAGALGVALAMSVDATRAAVPAVLARSVVAAATGGASTATAIALTTVIIRSMLMTRLKIASASVLAAIAVASAGGVAVGAFRNDDPKSAKRASALAPARSRDASSEAQGPAGSGPGIEGRIVDLEGRPIAGVQVAVTNLLSAPDNNLGRWLDQARDRGLTYPAEGLSPGSAPALRVVRSRAPVISAPKALLTATTGSDGRFRLAGIGPEQLAWIQVSGASIATTQLYAMGRDGAEVRATVHQGLAPSQVVFHARRFDYAAAPGKPIEGVVRDKDTGRPLAGISLQAAVYDEHSVIPTPGVEATTDALGHYRLAGLPRAPAYRLFVEPGGGEPYSKGTLRAGGDTPAFEPVTFDIALKQGIVIRGKVTDKVTGKPLSASIDVYAFADNPHVGEYPAFRSSSLARFFTQRDGQYEAVVLPGRGVIGVVVGGYMPRYRAFVGAEAIKGYDSRLMGFRTVPQICHVPNYHAMAELNLDPNAPSPTLDLQVEPSRTIVVTAIDPEGRPVAGTTAVGVSERFSWSDYPQSSPAIEIDAVDPARPRRLTVTHSGRKLVGSVYLKGDEPSPMTIQLQPFGTVTGRIVDDDARPRGGLAISSADGTRPARPAEQGILPGGAVSGGIRIGRDGRFRIEGLVPGLKYGAGASEGYPHYGEVFRDLIVTPGEVKDLDDLKLIKPERAG